MLYFISNNDARKTERQYWNEDAMHRAVEVIEEHKIEQPLYFDLISIQTRPCSVHDEQNIKN
jgi:hypothetical protein